MNEPRRIATLRLRGSPVHYDLIRFTDGDGQQREFVMRASHVQMPGKLKAALLDAGAVLGEDPAKTRAIINRLMSGTAPAGGELVITGGWYGMSDRRFIVQNEVIRRNRKKTGRLRPGTTNETAKPARPFILRACLNFDSGLDFNLVGPNALGRDFDGVLLRRGTAKGWKEEVARPAAHSTRMMFCIGVAFAATLLGLLNRTSFAVLLSGHTTAGKSTGVVADGSVIGIGSTQQMADWNTTPSRFEELARRHNDLPLPMEDLATMEGTDLQRFQSLHNTAYWLAGGARKGRLGRAGASATGRPVSATGVRTILLTSSEHGIADLAAAAGRRVDGGMLVRLVEIPVVEPGAEGVFDRLPALKLGTNPRKFAARLAKAITTGANRHQGKVLLAWLQKIVSNPEATRKYIRKFEAEFKALIDSEIGGARDARHGEKFALIFAAGALAIHLRLIPWTKEEYLTAVVSCFRASATSLSDNSDNLLRDGMERLERNLADQSRIAPWPNGNEATVGGTVDGWRKQNGTRTTHYVLASAMRGWFISPEQLRLVESHLKANGRLSADRAGNLTNQTRIPGMATRPRVYAIRDG